MGNVSIEFIVREQSTGYEEKTTQLLTVAQSPVNIQLIPDSVSFKPGLPLAILVLSQDPGGSPVEADVEVTLTYLNDDYEEELKETKTVATGETGMAQISVNPPQRAVALVIDASYKDSYTSQTLLASYSPTGSFIHVAQQGEAALNIGDTARFKVYATSEATNFYYEVVSRAGGLLRLHQEFRHCLQDNPGHVVIVQAAGVPDTAQRRGSCRLYSL
jgi:CD109 antigen